MIERGGGGEGECGRMIEHGEAKKANTKFGGVAQGGLLFGFATGAAFEQGDDGAYYLCDDAHVSKPRGGAGDFGRADPRLG